MSSVHETAGMHELENKPVPSDRLEGQAFEDPQRRVEEPSARQDAPKDLKHFSPDPLKRTDRYRLVHPYSLNL